MNGIVLRILLFLISYTPLALIFAVRTFPPRTQWRVKDASHFVVPGVFVGLTVLGIVLAVLIFRAGAKIGTIMIEPRTVEDEGGNAAAYLATYLFPFILVTGSSWRTWVAYFIYMIVLAIVTINSSLILINPTLYCLRRRVARITYTSMRGTIQTNEQSALVVCRKLPKVGDRVSVIDFASGLLETGKQHDRDDPDKSR